MKNKDLTDKYNKIFESGSGKFFSFNNFPESKLLLDMIVDWNDLRVLEIGCGEGRLAAMINFAGAAHIDAIDFSEEAIRIARQRIRLKNVSYQVADYREMKGTYDVVVLQGVLEHLDNPFIELKGIIESKLNEGGMVITSSPSFLNPRGYVWMTLQLLFDIPMSLTDLHSLCPFDFEKFAEENDYTLEIRSTDQDWGAGERTIIDFKHRLHNALRDADMDDSKVDTFLDWFKKAVPYHGRDEFSGATVAYKICR